MRTKPIAAITIGLIRRSNTRPKGTNNNEAPKARGKAE